MIEELALAIREFYHFNPNPEITVPIIPILLPTYKSFCLTEKKNICLSVSWSTDNLISQNIQSTPTISKCN